MNIDLTQEEKTLLNMKKIIAAAWRMNSRQLYICCKKLRKNQAGLLPGHIGCTFLEKLEVICSGETTSAAKVWPLLMQDTENLLKIIQKQQGIDKETCLAALPELEAHLDRYLKTGLGRAFVLDIKEKTGTAIPDKRRNKWKTILPESGFQINDKEELAEIAAWLVEDDRQKRDGKKELEQIAAWLMKDEQEQGGKKELEQIAAWLMKDTREGGRKAGTKKRSFLPVQLTKAAVLALACLSACFMSIWLYGQIEKVQSNFRLHQMKASASKETESYLEKNAGTQARSAESGKNTDAGRHVEKIQTSKKQQKKAQPEKLPQYKEMTEKYPQLYGWLQIPGTQIDLPVMHLEGDGEFYLHHDFTGAVSAEGALFVDEENSRYPQDDNTVIYGHNMKNGHMFGALVRYADVDFFHAHRQIQFDTLYETGIYEAVAVLKTRILNRNEQGFRYYQFFQYENEKEFQECRDFVEKNRLFETGSTLQYGDKILMLSTCEYSQENGRLVVIARKL